MQITTNFQYFCVALGNSVTTHTMVPSNSFNQILSISFSAANVVVFFIAGSFELFEYGICSQVLRVNKQPKAMYKLFSRAFAGKKKKKRKTALPFFFSPLIIRPLFSRFIW